MLKGLTFRKFRKEDLTKISEFRKSFLPYNLSIKSHEPEYYEWKCYKNPFQQGEMWLAEDGDAIVGLHSMTPKRMKILGAVVNAAEDGDSFTHPDYQRRGIFTCLAKAARTSALQRGITFVYGIPNEASLRAHEKTLDDKQVPSELRNLVKLLKPQQLLKAKLHFPPLAFILSPIIQIASKAIFAIGMRGITKSDIFIYQQLFLPDDIDTLWEQASRNYEVILVRTKDYLQWRYITNPDNYSILIARNRNGAILGYMVTKIGLSGNVVTGFIVDFLTIEDDPNIFKKLLCTSLQEFYRRKVSIVSIWTIKGGFYDKILLRAGFFPLHKVSLICYKNETGNRVLSGAYKWHFTMGDSDNI